MSSCSRSPRPTPSTRGTGCSRASCGWTASACPRSTSWTWSSSRWKASGPNSVIAFCDDSSAIRGTEVDVLVASDPLGPSPLETEGVLLHPTLTAETHNFPSGVAPFPGAATGGGGRIRDNQAVGRGGRYARRAPPTAWATCTSRATTFPGRKTATDIPPISRRRSTSSSRPATGPRATATASASR